MSSADVPAKRRRVSVGGAPPHISQLSFDGLQHVFNFTPQQTLYCVRLACRRWNLAILQKSASWSPHVAVIQDVVLLGQPSGGDIAEILIPGTRRPLVGGNWKCNGSIASIRALTQSWNDVSVGGHVDVVIGVPTIYLPLTQHNLRSDFHIAAENCYPRSGAFTGELSVDMMLDWNIKWCIIGHSERRKHFKETDAFLAEKTEACLANGISVIACIGETLAERKAGITFPVVFRQLDAYLEVVKKMGMWEHFVLAYEPVWAIGKTGIVATPEQAQQVHYRLRQRIAQKMVPEIAGQVRILYGGSVKPANCVELYRNADVDGFLVGGASLQPSFVQIVNSVWMK